MESVGLGGCVWPSDLDNEAVYEKKKDEGFTKFSDSREMLPG